MNITNGDNVPNACVFDKILWVVVTNSDREEGRGQTFKSYWTSSLQAKRASKEQGTYGSDAEVRSESHRVVQLDDGSFFLLGEKVNVKFNSKEDLAKIKGKALEKLTEEEKETLGL